jgi:hypothetical protein
MPAALFALVILEVVSLFLPRPACTEILLFYASHSNWDDTTTPSYWLRCGGGGGLTNVLPWISILSISASQVAMITV